MLISYKKRLLPILLITILLSITSCNKEININTSLSGNLQQYKNDSIFLFKTDDYFPGLKSSFYTASTKIDNQGNFSFTMKNLKEGYYQIITNNYGRLAYDIYIERGDHLYVYQSAWGEKPKFEVTGKGSEKHIHLKDDFKFFNKDENFKKIFRSKQNKTLLQFTNFLDSIVVRRISLLKNKELSKEIKDNFIEDIKLDAALLFLEHLKLRKYLTEGKFGYSIPNSKEIPNVIKSLDKIDFTRTAAKKVLEPYFEYLSHKSLIEKPSDLDTTIFVRKLEIINNLPKSIYREQATLSVLTNFSLAMFEENFFESIKAFDKKIKTTFTNINSQSIYKNNFKTYANLLPGKQAPEIILPDENGKLIKLSDFKGKLVYIDIWGTWCAPCIEEIPHSIKLQKEFAEEDIVFLFIALQSGDEQIQQWKKFIKGETSRAKKALKGNDFTGIHLVAENQFSNEQLLPYKLNFAPTYMLIDQEGNIVNTRAKRPSVVKNQIIELLKK